MKITGVIRQIDELGRIVLPVEFRKTLGIEKKDPLEINLDGDVITLKAYKPSCIFCGSGENIFIYHEKNVCEGCIDELRKKTV